MFHRRTLNALLICCVALSSTSLYGKDKHRKSDPLPEDQIQVVAYIPAVAEAVVRFVTTQHYRRNYLYVEHQDGKTLTLIDTTNVSQPSVLSEISYPGGVADGLVAATGNAALVATESAPSSQSAAAQTFRILNFTDPIHPSVQQEFNGVTAMARDDRRGLIFLANPAGVWILQQHFAPDPAAEKEWEHMMLDAR